MKNLAAGFLSDAERREIETCVREVEKTTSGEIVPMVVSASYHYPSAPLLGALILSVLAATVTTGLLTWQKAWGGLALYHLWVFPAVFSAGFLLFHQLIRAVPGFKRLFVSAEDAAEEVNEAAVTSFYRRGLQATRDRTGILLFISVFERRAFVLADEGINARVAGDAWKEIVDILVQGIRERRQGEAICRAVQRCGELVRTHFPVRHDDTNELDNLIVED
jgi:putative membrane protein